MATKKGKRCELWRALAGEHGIESRERKGRKIEYRARITVVVDGKKTQVTRIAKDRS